MTQDAVSQAHQDPGPVAGGPATIEDLARAQSLEPVAGAARLRGGPGRRMTPGSPRAACATRCPLGMLNAADCGDFTTHHGRVLLGEQT